MKLLPHTFKWIGLVIFLIGAITKGIDDGREGAWQASNENLSRSEQIDFVPLLPEVISHIAGYVVLFGLLIYILSKNKREDEFIQKLRYESAFIVFVISILLILVLHITYPDLIIKPHTLLSTQMIFYLLLRMFRRQAILEDQL